MEAAPLLAVPAPARLLASQAPWRQWRSRLALCLLLACVVSALLLLVCLQSVYLFDGTICSLDSVVYSARSMDPRFFTVGAVTQRDVKHILRSAIRQCAMLFKQNDITDWWSASWHASLRLGAPLVQRLSIS